MSDFSILQMVIGAVTLAGVIGFAFVLFLHTRNLASITALLADVNTNKPLLDAIEGLTKSVPPEVVQMLIAGGNLAKASAAPDVKAVIDSGEAVLKKLTDGEPN